MFVHAAGVDETALVREKRESQKAGLMDETLAAAVGASFGPQLIEQRFRETPDRSLPAMELVVELEHRRNETWTKRKRRAAQARPRSGRACGTFQEHLPLD